MAWQQTGPIDFYTVLGVKTDASEAEIAKAYRKAALLNHPDKAPGSGASVARFQVIQEAYETLRDPVRRLVYDEARQGTPMSTMPPPPGPAPSTTEWDEVVPSPEPPPATGGLAVGACLVATTFAWTCGATAALGALLCGISARVLQKGNRQWIAFIACICFLLFLESSMAWMLGMYVLTLAGLMLLAEERDQLPDFLPYLLFAGYLLLFLLAPVRPSTRVLVPLPGFVLIEEGPEADSAALPECAALFTWGIVVVRLCMARDSHPAGRKERSTATMWEV